jgi:hypothetical protein
MTGGLALNKNSAMIRLSISAVLLLIALSSSAAEKNTFEGIVHATMMPAGTEPNHFVFTRKGDQLRIENTTNTLEPVNIVDLRAKTITIVFRHNTTFVQIDLTKKPAQPNFPSEPAGMQLPPTTSQPGTYTPGSAPPAGASQVGPNLASLPSPPPGAGPHPLPSIPGTGVPPGGDMPASPNGVPQMPFDVGPVAGGVSMMAHMRPGSIGAPKLRKTDKTKKIQGFDCRLYTMTERGENFEIWATNDSALFPFQLITRDYIGRRLGPQMLEETWGELLRNNGLFPIEATLKLEPAGQERLSFKIDKTEKNKIEDEKLFEPPEKYIRIPAPEL